MRLERRDELPHGGDHGRRERGDLGRRERMQSGTLGPELQHRADDHRQGPPSPLRQPVREFDRPVQRARIRVVGVVDHRQAAQLEHRPPPAGQAHTGERRHRPRRIRSHFASHRERDQRVLDLVEPHHGQRDRVAAPGEPRAAAVVELGYFGPHVRLRPGARDHRAGPAPRFHGELRRVGADHRHPRAVREREFLLHHPGERAEACHVRVADV